jgi:superfamily II DNA or RNA helicase
MAVITLRNFEKKIPVQMLARGKKLWDKGKVRDLVELSDGSWTAGVEGSSGYDYELILIFKEDTLSFHECECPYESGICKHRVAVLYAIREELNNLAGSDEEVKPLQSAEIINRVQGGRPASKRLEKAGNTEQPVHKNVQPPDTSIAALFEAYEKLEQPEKRCVKIAAAAWETISPTKFAEIFNACGFRYKGLNLYARDLTTMLQSLTDSGFLTPVDSRLLCNRAFAQALCDAQFAADPDFAIISAKVRQLMLIPWNGYGSDPERIFREMRLARYLNRPGEFSKFFNELCSRINIGHTYHTIIDFWLLKEANPDYLDTLPPEILGFLLVEKLRKKTFFLEPADSFEEYVMKKLPDFAESTQANLVWQMGQLLLFRGEWDVLTGMYDIMTAEKRNAFDGMLRLAAGDTAASSALFNDARKELRKESRDTKNELRDLTGVFQMMAAMPSLTVSEYVKWQKKLDYIHKHDSYFVSAFDQLHAVMLSMHNDTVNALRKVQARFANDFPLMHFFQYLCLYWIDEKLIDLARLAVFHENTEKNGYAWLADEVLALRIRLEPGNEALFSKKRHHYGAYEVRALVELLTLTEPWENALNLMSGMADDVATSVRRVEKDVRMIWIADFERNTLTPKEQTFGKKGWSSGKVISDSQLLNANLPCMSEQDRRVARTMAYGRYYHGLNSLSTWQALVGHPLLFSAQSPDIPLRLTEEKPVLIAQKHGDGFQISFSPKFAAEGFRIIRESPTRYTLLVITADHVRIARSFNGDSLFVPEKAAERLSAVMNGLGKLVPVRSVFEEENLPLLPPEARVCVHLLPVGDGFHVEIYSKPFRSAPPYFKPGEGNASVTTMIGGERVRTLRDLKAEADNATKLLEQVKTLRLMLPAGGIWKLENAENCLELLVQLHPLVESGQIMLEWPKGEKLQVVGKAGFDHFKMKIRGNNDWFEVTGEINVNEDHVLNMRQLLAWSSSAAQFVEVSPGKFLALTEEFRLRLRKIDSLLTARKDGALQLHPLASGAFDVFTEMVKDLDFDRKFQENQDKLRVAFEKKYKIPRDFNASLRPYQQEGFEWMSRCAAGGLGACLADDMGLGKTVQALALLTSRAKSGPALVVAPASVCRNWMAEARKFAPALRPVLFGEGDRSSIIEKAGKGDLIIITYDLMARSGKELSEKQFSTLVLDEAQSIKNRQSRRSEAAMQLNGDFRLIMTGTPVENHLGELWNLFQFANPGLLGPIEHFNQQFAIPIERYGDEGRREQLRRLIQPFILRRRKEDVLRELPAKTEITLRVALSPQERVFYEALRRNALETLTADTESGAGEKHLRILAELMRLRRAACHPNLADAAAGFTSSAKLELFGEILNELISNGHKALVFSQFVGHLKILEEYVKDRNIPYQYLDGQTPASQRQERINAFQSGEGDLFLISLKAGGTGLNLTAADYVIHTDPWWNPAVEDQASDRAHRIGQMKPVTVYRIVAEHTIEEKILQLHAEKRDLADSLLEGTNVSSRLTAEDLLRLMDDE